jgi:hypothetical protein
LLRLPEQARLYSGGPSGLNLKNGTQFVNLIRKKVSFPVAFCQKETNLSTKPAGSVAFSGTGFFRAICATKKFRPACYFPENPYLAARRPSYTQKRGTSNS